jgi:hypothetical protein
MAKHLYEGIHHVIGCSMAMYAQAKNGRYNRPKVQIGSVIRINYGPQLNKLATIVDLVDAGRVPACILRPRWACHAARPPAPLHGLHSLSLAPTGARCCSFSWMARRR